MNSLSMYLIIFIVLLMGFTGYYYLDKVAPMQATVDDLRQKNQELLFQVENFEQKNVALSNQLEENMRKVSEQKNDEINNLKKTYDELIGGLKEQVEKGEITITQIADQLNVKIVDSIIFPSGKSELTDAGVNVLKRVGDILKNVKDKNIRVEGHTDDIPIHPKLQHQFATNWELSAARAINVARFLQEKVGIDARHLEATARSQYKPVASNKTKEGRMQNRRIEIMLLPGTEVMQDVMKQATQKF